MTGLAELAGAFREALGEIETATLAANAAREAGDRCLAMLAAVADGSEAQELNVAMVKIIDSVSLIDQSVASSAIAADELRGYLTSRGLA